MLSLRMWRCVLCLLAYDYLSTMVPYLVDQIENVAKEVTEESTEGSVPTESTGIAVGVYLFDDVEWACVS